MKNLLRSLSFVIFPLLFMAMFYVWASSKEDRSLWTGQHPLTEKLDVVREAWPSKQPLVFFLDKNNSWVVGPEYSKSLMRQIRLGDTNYPSADQVLDRVRGESLIFAKVCGYSIYEMHQLKQKLRPLAAKTVLLFCRQDAHTMFTEDIWFKQVTTARALVFHKMSFMGLGRLIPLDGDFLSFEATPFLTDKEKRVAQKRGHVLF